ncbi:MAG: HD domain-containing phosphohydrolase [Candidatus Omnitrophota bacterium]
MLRLSFQVKITLVIIFSMLFAGALSNLLIYKFSLESQFNELRSKLMIIAQTAGLLIDADTLLGVPLSHQGTNSEAYKVIAQKLKKIREVNPQIKYIYTMARTQEEGIWQFIVDPEPEPQAGRGNKDNPTSYPGDRYDASRFPEMLKAFHGPSADTKLEIDEWGVTLSGYAPVRDSAGEAVAMVGVDVTADNVYLTQKAVHRRAFLVMLLGIITSIALGMLISRRVTGPLKKLVEGTRSVARGNLNYAVAVEGSDELSELAASFNQMSKSLYESRKKIMSYFYDVVQSMVRILEARDHYTRGHSEMVAQYSEMIALKMGFPKEKIEELKEMALLHDIGKLGIKESILNKREKLTEEEWGIIRKHPIIGEDILKPILITEEMLAMVRSHHERYDGKGYPDALGQEKINIFAAILSVADAYDAMTSCRAYREAMAKADAIEELKKNSGTQFNPKVVQAFLEVIDGV